jgi:hypothetical protein
MLVEENGAIKQLAAGLNSDSPTPDLTSGILADVVTAIAKAQQLAKSEFDLHRPVNIIIEGRHFDAPASAALSLRTLNSSQVCVVIGADNDISIARPSNTYYAAIGDALGCISLAAVNECIGWVGKFPLTDTANGYFLNAGLSDGNKINTYEADWGTLHDKGYIFAKPHTGKSGFWWNSDPTCTLVSDDEAYLSNSRTLNKAARIVRAALLDDLNSPITLTAQGTIQPVQIGDFEAKCETDLDDVMMKAGEISALSVYIDPNQNFITDGEELDVVFKIVPVGVAREIVGKISLVPSL